MTSVFIWHIEFGDASDAAIFVFWHELPSYSSSLIKLID
jgi:hypothetical protein